MGDGLRPCKQGGEKWILFVRFGSVALSGASVDIERCRREITAIEAELLAGNPDILGLVLALSDWHCKLRILQDEERRQAGTGRRVGGGLGELQALTE